MNGMAAVTALAVHISGVIKDTRVFKYEKPTNYRGAYIALNHLAFQYGAGVNTSGVVNVNIHVPDLTDGQPDTRSLQVLADRIRAIIPERDESTEDGAGLRIGSAFYALDGDSSPMSDTDGTHFANLRVRVTFLA